MAKWHWGLRPKLFNVLLLVSELSSTCGNHTVELWISKLGQNIFLYREQNRLKLHMNKPREQSSWGQHGAHLGPVGPRWAYVDPRNLAIGEIYVSRTKVSYLCTQDKKDIPRPCPSVAGVFCLQNNDDGTICSQLGIIGDTEDEHSSLW